MDTLDSIFTIEARIIGQRNMPQPIWQIELPEHFSLKQSTKARPPFLLRDLIVYIVRYEVQAFQQRQQERRLLHVLGSQKILEAASGGKIAMGGSPAGSEQGVDEQAAIGAALRAFEDGLYFVFLNGIHRISLEDEIFLESRSTVTFIRLVALIGG